MATGPAPKQVEPNDWQTVEPNDWQTVDESRPRETVSAAPKKYSLPWLKSEAMTLRDKAVNVLPAVGGVVGGLVGGAASPIPDHWSTGYGCGRCGSRRRFGGMCASG